MQSENAVLGGQKQVTSLRGEQNIHTLVGAPAIVGVVDPVPGAWVAAVPQNVINRAGAGELKWLLIRSANATAKNVRVRIIRDTVVVYDKTFAYVTANSAHLPMGGYVYDSVTTIMAPMIGITVPHSDSLIVEVTNSASEAAGGVLVREVAEVW